MKKYPNQVYSGITSDPETWGMCHSEESARKCAEDWWKKEGLKIYIGEKIFDILLLTIKIVALRLFPLLMVILSIKYFLENGTL